ncbi:hypothetical protein TREAZ_1273 [Leadbettera azotonutricia ZAS-9]|uniref:Uncharacterized protein n=1 Tax=Leadbettera azotonutricia (strain ATCC BAA-888 / DSM 13862 / ZAS-9) TaxID=545695 RepID=F5YG31_LEAAZ|nr:hypothetical protein TREAZ_1273 [Leadbettera azotonutricia ZAS-9]
MPSTLSTVFIICLFIEDYIIKKHLCKGKFLKTSVLLVYY